jgi:hypothetical protein
MQNYMKFYYQCLKVDVSLLFSWDLDHNDWDWSWEAYWLNINNILAYNVC